MNTTPQRAHGNSRRSRRLDEHDVLMVVSSSRRVVAASWLRPSARARVLLLLLCVCACFGEVAARAQDEPRRIISFIPAVTEMLFALGVGDRVVAVGNFDKYPPEIQTLPKVGALLDPNLERILSLRPDLVTVYGSQTDLRAQLERARVPLFLYSHAGLADVTQTILDLGARVGRSERAQELTGEIERALSEVRGRVANQPRPRTLIVFERESYTLRGIYASGGYGFIHDIVTAAGGDNIFADIKQQAVQATTELIIARRPDVILEVRAEPLPRDQQVKEVASWTPLSSVPAVRGRRIHIIADPRTVIPGPRVAEGAAVIARVLHPEAFK
jgi:iron complex transport system substrate-binding protein